MNLILKHNNPTEIIQALSESAIIFTLDRQGNIIESNETFAKISKYSKEELLYYNISLLNSKYHSKEFWYDLWQTVLGGNVWKGEIKNKAKDGSYYWLEAFIHPLFNSQGEIDKFLSVGYDISAKRDAIAEIQKVKKEAEYANRMKSEFLANMSHEIRTPLNAIIGFSEILVEEIFLSDSIKDKLTIIYENGKNLLNLINDILDISKIEAGKLSINYKFFNLENLVESIKNIYMHIAENKNIKFSTSIAQNFPSIYLDESRMNQILINLIGNALKFTDEGFVQVNISFEPAEEQESIHLKIEVIDTGIGIKEKEVEQIFETFSQQSGQDSRKYGGTGLGLAITRKLTDMMHGKINVSSIEGQGSTFTLLFPDVPIQKAKNIKSRTKESNESIVFEKATILLVDGLFFNRELIVGFLKNYDSLEIIQSDSGLDALGKLKRKKPDLIITDIKIPDFDGNELLEKIREQEGFKEIPILAYTAIVHGKILNNFDDIILKPLKKKKLIKTLKKFLPIQEIKPQEEVAVNDNNIQSEITQFTASTLREKLDIIQEVKMVSRMLILKDPEEIIDYVQRVKKIITPDKPYPLLENMETVAKSFDITKIEIALKNWKEFLTNE